MGPVKPVIYWFAEHRTAANLLMILLSVLGLLSAGNLKRETLPDFAPTKVEVSVQYPGATAEDVEEAVCQRIEDALDGVTGVYEIVSEARENMGKVVVEMVEGGNIDQFLSDVKTEVEAIDDFPDQAEKPIIRRLNRTDDVVSIAVYGPMSVPDLKLYCERFKDRLLRLPEVSQVDIEGFSDHQIRIEVPDITLKQFGVSAADVADIVARQSLDLPSGTIETRNRDFMVRFMDERDNVRAMRDLVVLGSDSGAELRLGDIATITDRFELDEDKVIFNGQRAGVLNINKTKSEDTLKVFDAVMKFLEKERAQAPKSVHYVVTRNVSEIVRDRLNLLVDNGLQGLTLVLVTMWVFFSFRYSFWVALGLPVSFLGAIFMMDVTGMSLNLISMVGLLLALGLIMDDAIVISENVAVHVRKGKSPLAAVVDGTSQVFPGVLSSFLTTVFVFGSISVFIAGNIGKVLWVMPVVLIMALSVSLVEAFLILPNHLSHAIVPEGEEEGRFRAWFNKKLLWFRDNVQGAAIKKAVDYRYMTIGLCFALLLSAVALIAGGLVKFRAFPDIQGDVLQARILLPQGTTLDRTQAVVDKVVAGLEQVDEELSQKEDHGRRLVQNYSVLFNSNADAGEQGPHVATVSVDLLGAQIRHSDTDLITSMWRENVGTPADVVFINYKEPVIGPAGRDIEIRLEGENLDDLKSASMDLVGWLSGFDGVLDLSDDLRPGKPEFRIRMKEGAMALGVDSASVARQLRAAFYGQEAREIQVGPESYEIDVRVSQEDQDSLEDLDNFHVATSDKKLVPLSTVCDIDWGRGYGVIKRVDQRRTVTITGDVDSDRANAQEIVGKTKKEFLPRLMKKYPEVIFDLQGQAKEGGKTGASLRKAFLTGLFGVFLLLSLQFHSYVEPVAVILTIPLAFIGVVWGHLIMGLDISMPSTMGFVSLAGVAVNDSILLVQFLKSNVDKGLDVAESAIMASKDRFRAVLITSLTTIMGLMPLMLEKSLQAQILIPLAVSIVFGLVTSTLMVLYFVPCFYAVLDDFGLIRKNRKHGLDGDLDFRR